MADVSFWTRFVLAGLATWRVTHLVAAEDGPGDVIVRIRASLGHGWAATLMDCFQCLSLWIAAPAALFVTRDPLLWLFSWLALSGAACLLERLGQPPVALTSMPDLSEDSATHVLRTETRRPVE